MAEPLILPVPNGFDDEPDLGCLEEFDQIIRLQGLRSALLYLNALVPHRFTALYRLEGSSFVCKAAVDAEQEELTLDLTEVPVADSYCQFVVRDGVYWTPDSLTDPVLAGHKHRELVRSYIGTRVGHPGQSAQGSLCHIDFSPWSVNVDQVAFFEHAAMRLRPFL